ncbi:MAG TPA: single-stranded DNA-binding protein, partial [Gammaproteobacteria bacterium]|nr:single-stranded DNA-binding protein [Gammaproteobacteria bacterium]
MSKDLNQCNFIGNIGKQPEIKYTAGGQAIASALLWGL